jgi:glycosyltransferase involved in cell wall biosynthesis
MTDEELEIPPIEPVAEGLPRPRWSVMIPTYNAERTIGETLRSVLGQARTQHYMQICVVDNVSTDQTLTVVEQTVADCGMRGRVEIHKNPSNLGMVGNFNACLRLSRGELIHLLHADDFIRPGFYEAMEARLQQHPDAEICAARVLTIDPHGELEYITNRLARTGELTVFDVAYENQLYPPGVVVRRAGYERVGGYSNVISYLPDWEMWTRLLEHCPGVFVNEPLACYRQTPGNATDYFSRTATDLRDMMRFGHVLGRRVPDFSHDHWRTCIRRHAEWGMNKWRNAGDETAFQANQEIWRQLASRREKRSHRLELAKGFAKKWADNSVVSPIVKLGRALLSTKELGKRLERSVRKFVRRGRKKDASKASAGQETRTSRAA